MVPTFLNSVRFGRLKKQRKKVGVGGGDKRLIIMVNWTPVLEEEWNSLLLYCGY